MERIIDRAEDESEKVIGHRLRALRVSRGLSLRAVAARVGITPGALSQIENGRNDPSLATLKKILSTLGSTLAEFFAGDGRSSERSSFVYRSRDLIDVAKASGLKFLTLPPAPSAGRAMQIMFETYAPGADTGPESYSHAGEEGGFCIAGSVEITVDGRREVLGPGDAYYYPSSLPHRWRNIGNVPATVISACSPPTF